MRYTGLVAAFVATGVFAGLTFVAPRYFAWFFIVSGLLLAIGLHDLLQAQHTLLRNYPLLAHFRWFFESIRPEIRQYLIESDTEATPFSREARSQVYARAKGANDADPFGTELDVYAEGHEWLAHSIAARAPAETPPRVHIGGPDCSRPYAASTLNISAMSFGSLSANAIRALNKGAALGGFAHDTGEGSISRHHKEFGGDLIWELGSGYFGCRARDGAFDRAQFVDRASDDQVKMVEIKLSQGAKPGHGGVLPGRKVTQEIAEARGVPVGQTCNSPPYHTAFSTPIEMMEFIADLREGCGGKPVGFKLCIGHGWQFMSLAKAMLKTGITPDFIVVDGAEGGTGAAPLELVDSVGTPLREGLVWAHNTLVGAGLRERIKIGASGKITSGFRMASNMALGADWCNSARGFMFAVGCVQSESCHTDRCPTGVATQNPWRQRAVVVPEKAERVYHFHKATVAAMQEVVATVGLDHPAQLAPEHLCRRTRDSEIQSADQVYRFLKTGELLVAPATRGRYETAWARAQAESFLPRSHAA
ncbi:FMN-binding glutamate synthase family protein [Salinisphaera sp. LB1]|uniref:FMN-binding glutamate synthase family protein n=1 Tax=Salinisphaera sp. LB1 TaxID=2183911 RepID=UPI000D705C31|nr:FMN-binding glutamate synthase family protein [Salinisphaera sp. LB1]AWN16317.1 Ferredoxin-dependent glutamate synthase [Salinisphaera sp. LB1]